MKGGCCYKHNKITAAFYWVEILHLWQCKKSRQDLQAARLQSYFIIMNYHVKFHYQKFTLGNAPALLVTKQEKICLTTLIDKLKLRESAPSCSFNRQPPAPTGGAIVHSGELDQLSKLNLNLGAVIDKLKLNWVLNKVSIYLTSSFISLHLYSYKPWLHYKTMSERKYKKSLVQHLLLII